LIRYGLSYRANVVGLERLVGAADGLAGRTPADTQTRPEELGPTFIKLGQLLATRADLLSSNYRVELAKLQDSAPAVPSDVIKDIVEPELHAPADTAFAVFQAVPLACASVTRTLARI
jgi:ubiquinone biosynthesis protein